MDKKNKNKHILDIKKTHFKNKSAIIIDKNCNSTIKLDTHKTTFTQKNRSDNKENILNRRKDKLEKMKKINSIRKILNKKSRNIFIKDNESLRKSISEEKIVEKQNSEENQKKDYYLDRLKTIVSLLERSNKRKHNNYSAENIFKKFLSREEDDKIKFKKILDPLSNAFKGDLKEVQLYVGKDKQSIWMKRSTANIVSFGNSFQLIDDELFFKNRNRIVSKYPGIQKQANIIVLENKKNKDNKIITKLKTNSKKIRNIINDSYDLLKTIKLKSMKVSKSQPSIQFKRKSNAFHN
jgi:hypothetical protein